MSDEMRGLWSAIETAQRASSGTASLPRMRTHLFFRNIQGVWACSDTDCPEVAPLHRDKDRTVGKLYFRPRHRCDCGKRVLRLLYCQSCGDVFLGGYLAPSIEPGQQLGTEDRYLVAELGELDSIPDQARASETCTTFAMYWPRPVAEASIPDVSWSREGYQFTFRPASFDSLSGELKISKRNQTGWNIRS